MTDILKGAVVAAGAWLAAPAAIAACAPPEGHDGAAPAIDPARLVAHTESIRVDAPLYRTLAVVEAMSLDETIAEDGGLPGVAGTVDLTEGGFGDEGTRRVVCLTDGGTVLEEVLERRRDATTSSFRYVVWNYTSAAARAVDYAVGEFRFAESDGMTEIVWTYAFALRPDRFPGNLGWLGERLFRWSFLERDYAGMMRGTLAGYRRAVEG